jgi:molecular chaperone DnaK (HSP70)
LRLHCRELKEAIHANTRKVYVELGRCLTPSEHTALAVAQDQVEVVEAAAYEAECRPLIDRTLQLVERALRAPAATSLESESVEGQLAGLYVVGGASALPAVGRALRAAHGRRVRRSPYPSASIAIGLAIAADEAAQYSVAERFHHSLGVFREAARGRRVNFDPIVGPETPLPAPGQSPVHISRRYRPVHNVGHFRFVECGWLDAQGQPCGDIKPYANVLFPFDPELRGRAALENVPVHSRAAGGQEIEEVYAIDDSGAVTLTIRDLSSDYCQHYGTPAAL